MTFQEIKEVKNLVKNAKINKHGTSMFLDGIWAVSLHYEIIVTSEFFKLAEYCKQHELTIFISRNQIHIQ